MWYLIKPGTQIDFVGNRKLWVTLSLIAVLGSIALMFTKGLNMGIDFKGGAEVQVHVPLSWDIGKLRSELSAGDIKGLRVVQIGEPGENQFLVRAQGDDKSLNLVSNQIRSVLAKSFKEGSGPDDYAVLKEDVVGAVAGGLLARKGFLAVFYALLAILVYVGVRFDIRYAPGAVIALFHDTVVTLGIFVLLQKQFDLTILAAILALVGYSNNDTIIVFDRVRETQQLHPEWTIEKAVNVSVNETLGRTLMTSITTLVTVMALWLFGGSVIHDFAFAFMIGIIVGSYSSIFIASSLVIYFTHYQEKRARKLMGKGGKATSVSSRPSEARV